MAIVELAAQMQKTLEYHQETLSFQIPYYLHYSIFLWDLDAHMDMIHTRIRFHHLYSFVFTQFYQNFSYRPAIPAVYQLKPEFRCEYVVILTVPRVWFKL